MNSEPLLVEHRGAVVTGSIDDAPCLRRGARPIRREGIAAFLEKRRPGFNRS